ncbi:MAG TPA: outer membrane beta-barrel protein [Hyphomicrobium sp.]|jgi:opacity protein-like surface antigen
MLFTRNVLLLGAALVLGSALGASAADLGNGSLKDAPVMEPMPAASAGWYARVDGGYNWFMTPDFSAGDLGTPDSKMGGAWSVGGGLGYYFGRGFRGDITVDHLFDAEAQTGLLCSCTVVGTTKFDVSSTVVLANLYYDFNRGGRFNPYIGGGVGFSHNETSSVQLTDPCGCTAGYDGKSSNSFAAAAMAGVSWRIRGGGTTYVGGLKDRPVAVSEGNALYLDFGYRFLYLGQAETGSVFVPLAGESVTPKAKDLIANELRVGLRYDLN